MTKRVLLLSKAVKNDKTYMACSGFALHRVLFQKKSLKQGQEYNPGKLDEWVQDFSKHQLFKNKKEDRSPLLILYVIQTVLCSCCLF